ncbi:MAG: acyltransferase [Phycisphaera sp. TMED9]|nr:MAG: acyltransferase [Phycisphaera sp. TMED9]
MRIFGLRIKKETRSSDQILMRISDVDSSRKNNMDLIRFLAASAVIYGHAFHLQNLEDPLESVTGRSTGSLAVAIFFSLSGFLIAKSITTRRSVLEFVVARALRILPALFVVNLLVILVAGFAWTTLGAGEFFSNSQTWSYFAWNSSLLKCQYELPGVFESNPGGPAVNGSLWTLPVEARMYGIVFLAGLTSLALGKFLGGEFERRRRVVGVFAIVAMVLSLFGWAAMGIPYVGGVLSEPGVELLGYFGFGMFAHAFRERIHLDGRIVVAGGVALLATRDSAFANAMFIPWLAYACLWISYTPRLQASGFGSRGDFSYGIYIFAFPVQQWIYSVSPGMAPLSNAGFTFCIVIVLAALSFWCIERPCLGLKKPLSEKIQMFFGKRVT